MEFLLNNKSINLNDFLQQMNTEKMNNQPVIEELSERESNSTLEDEEVSSVDNTVESSDPSIEEDVPDFFSMEELEDSYKGFIPESLVRDTIYKEIQKETKEERDKLLLYYSLSQLQEVPDVVFFKEMEGRFKEIQRKVYWKFYKLLTKSEEFEEFVIEKIIETNNPRLLIYHFIYETKKDIEGWTETIHNLDMLSFIRKEKDEYAKLIHSLFQEIYC